METLQDMFVEEVKDLYDAERQISKALPKMAKACSDEELRMAFQEHLEQTREQIARLEQIFGMAGKPARGKPCKGMKGLIEEGQEVMSEEADMILDTAIAGAAQKVEHYEIAGYGTARTLARQLGMKEAAQLLQQTLQEEGDQDKRLTQICKRLLKAGQAQERQSRKMESPAPKAQRGKGEGTRQNGKKGSAAGSRMTTDHEEIRRWAEERGGRPATVAGTGGRDDSGLLRIDFPGYSGGSRLQEISWDEFFEKFDEKDLVFVYQEQSTKGEKSNFNKLVSRESAEEKDRRGSR